MAQKESVCTRVVKTRFGRNWRYRMRQYPQAGCIQQLLWLARLTAEERAERCDLVEMLSGLNQTQISWRTPSEARKIRNAVKNKKHYEREMRRAFRMYASLAEGKLHVHNPVGCPSHGTE